ncbi:MAG: YARHG domain-containing protein [Clostridioides sp.]|nr:YARHG domain-containing protein [Clostridioides sp.]
MKRFILVAVVGLSIALSGCNITINTNKPSADKQGSETTEPAQTSTTTEASRKDDGYLFPSDTEYITEKDVEGRSKDAIALMRNEIYARHGYVFSKQKYRDYFGTKSWYKENKNFSEDSLNKVEKKNAEFLSSIENPKSTSSSNTIEKSQAAETKITFDDARAMARNYMKKNVDVSWTIYEDWVGERGYIFSVSYPDDPNADDDALEVYFDGSIGWSDEVD